MTVEQLAAATGEPVERLRAWEALGLLRCVGEDFPPESVERVRLIVYAVERGVTAEGIAGASAEQGDVLGRYLDLAGPGRVAARSTRSVEQAAGEAGLDLIFVRRLMVASGLADQSEIYDEDTEMLHIAAVALEAGLPAEALLQILRVFNDALTRVAEAENRLFHFYVHERLRVSGLTGAALVEATESASGPLLGLIEPAVLYFHTKAWQRAQRDDMVVHLAEDLRPPDGTVGQVPVTVLFVDLASFTVMTDVMGDSSAAEVVERFSDLVREAAAECDGRVLKQIGDEFMLVFRDSRLAVSYGVSVMARVAEEPQFPEVRIGAHAGTALYREGDYLGATVNIAARVAAVAERAQFLVTDTVHDATSEHPGVTFTSVGRRALKNVAEPVELFDVQPHARAERPIDPVCGMALDPSAGPVRLEWDGRQVLFCSPDCRDRFVAEPDRYRAGEG